MNYQNQGTGNKNLVLDEALASLARGWSVMPISRTSKTPMVGWLRYQDELPSVVKVRNWFGADYPDANLGGICGALSRYVILDVDEIAGHDEIKRRGGMPETVTVRTSEDWKLHFYLEHPGFRVGNFQKKCGDHELPGLDFRGDGGYAMLPPSLHMKSGQPYTWLVSPDEAPIAPCPDWLLEVLQHRIDKESAPVQQGPECGDDAR
ncbi:bifunctional DNA primase/polymerase, partial [bacterium]